VTPLSHFAETLRMVMRHKDKKHRKALVQTLYQIDRLPTTEERP